AERRREIGGIAAAIEPEHARGCKARCNAAHIGADAGVAACPRRKSGGFVVLIGQGDSRADVRLRNVERFVDAGQVTKRYTAALTRPAFEMTPYVTRKPLAALNFQACSSASSSAIMPSITLRPPSQNAGSRASRPNGFNSSLWCLVPPAA